MYNVIEYGYKIKMFVSNILVRNKFNIISWLYLYTKDTAQHSIPLQGTNGLCTSEQVTSIRLYYYITAKEVTNVWGLNEQKVYYFMEWPMTFDLNTPKSNLGCILILHVYRPTFIPKFIKIRWILLKLSNGNYN